MTGYLVSTYGNDNMYIGPMRLFDNEADAKAYITAVLQKDHPTFTFNKRTASFLMRLYKVSDNAEPVKLAFP